MATTTTGSKFELIGNSLEDVLDAIKTLKFHYGKDFVKVVESKNDSENSRSVMFDDLIKLRSGGKDPKSNIVKEMNYVLEGEMKTTKLYKTN